MMLDAFSPKIFYSTYNNIRFVYHNDIKGKPNIESVDITGSDEDIKRLLIFLYLYLEYVPHGCDLKKVFTSHKVENKKIEQDILQTEDAELIKAYETKILPMAHVCSILTYV